VDDINAIQRLVVWVLPVLFAITVHEVAHGWMARRLGDPTAMMLGRLTLNPLKHIDPIGTLLVPGLLLLVGGFIFGWAKPVPVTPENLRDPRRDMAWVAIAGPASNLIMALLWAIVMRVGYGLSGVLDAAALPLVYMGAAGISINIMLFVLNLLPVPPLDGSRVVSALLPGPLAARFAQIEPYGMIILLGLLISGILGKILLPFVTGLEAWLFSAAGL
jgi:Zn-dependent protease